MCDIVRVYIATTDLKCRAGYCGKLQEIDNTESIVHAWMSTVNALLFSRKV